MESKSRVSFVHQPGLRPTFRGSLLAASLITLSSLCQASNNCPWINEATASGLLGGDATGSFSQPSPSEPAVCMFVQTTAEGTHTLRIAVQQTPDFLARLESEYKACGAGAAPLTAIGNEARMCEAGDPKKVTAERVVGRVRDQVFTITLGSSIKRDSLLTRDALKTRVLTAAEQVSGNLF
jgi:hypothetical protein